MKMIRWMCRVQFVDRLSRVELRQRLRLDYIITVLADCRLHCVKKGREWVNNNYDWQRMINLQLEQREPETK